MNNLLERSPSQVKNLPIRIVKEIPKTLKNKAVEKAVQAFVTESNVKGDAFGVYQQSLETIASMTFLGGTGDFWLAEEDGDVAAYVLGRFVKEIDNQLTYWVSQAWVSPLFRRQPIVKEWWDVIKNHARRHFAKHLVIVSSRNPRAYQRWFGTNIRDYATLMLENLED